MKVELRRLINQLYYSKELMVRRTQLPIHLAGKTYIDLEFMNAVPPEAPESIYREVINNGPNNLFLGELESPIHAAVIQKSDNNFGFTIYPAKSINSPAFGWGGVALRTGTFNSETGTRLPIQQSSEGWLLSYNPLNYDYLNPDTPYSLSIGVPNLMLEYYRHIVESQTLSSKLHYDRKKNLYVFTLLNTTVRMFSPKSNRRKDPIRNSLENKLDIIKQYYLQFLTEIAPENIRGFVVDSEKINLCNLYPGGMFSIYVPLGYSKRRIVGNIMQQYLESKSSLDS